MMMSERLSPERSVRLLRAKAAELESMVPSYLDEIKVVNPNHFAQDIRKLYEMAGNTLADIALIAGLLADHIENTMIRWPEVAVRYTEEAPENDLTTVEVQHDASFNERVARDRKAEMHLRHLERDPRQPFDGS